MSIDRFPMEGIEIWQNPGNGYVVYQIHYKADPKKRDPVWIHPIKSAMPIRKFQQEYELVWDSFQGQPVYADFDEQFHCLTTDREAWTALPLLIGIDFGLTPAAVICQYQEDQFVVLEEFVKVNMGADRFGDALRQHLSVHYPSFFRKHMMNLYVDPSGFFKKDTDETTCVQVLSRKGFSCYPGPVTWEERRGAVDQVLTKRVKSGPGFLINKGKCPVVVRGFKGGYRYPEGALDKEPTKVRPVKDEYSHPHDALQYVVACMLKLQKKTSVHIPIPGYVWTQGSLNAR